MTRYTQSGGVSIAYQVLGEGELDIVGVPLLISHLDLFWEDRFAAAFYRRLASLGRLIMFDKRDTGLSDSAPGDPSLQQRIEDIEAVMDACGSSRAVLFGYSEGVPMSILFAATYPERVGALILAAGAARWPSAPDYPCGRQSEEMMDAIEHLAEHRWGQATASGGSRPRASPSLPPFGSVRAVGADGGEPERAAAHRPDDPQGRRTRCCRPSTCRRSSSSASMT